MSNRSQIDSFIDDDDEFCPLCIEEFDLSDKNFKPCPCGYQICQFCFNNIKTHNEEGRCPNCRRVYDESTIQYKVPDADEFKADLALKHRKAAAAKKKEVEKREIEASSRKNLAGVRVVQKNLVYVIGLNPTIRDESQLLQTLRGPEYFGQYGDIEKIVVSKAKPSGNPNQGIGVYVTFARKADAATCITAVDGTTNGDRALRAQYGTTKYCSSFLRNEQCSNRNCTFLHETGEDSDSYSRQDLSSMNTAQRHVYSNGAAVPFATQVRPLPQAALSASQSIPRQGGKDEVGGKQGTDGSALPSSASWANKDAPLNRARRSSLSGSRSSPSPKIPSISVMTKPEDLRRAEKQPALQESSRRSPTPAQPQSSASQTFRAVQPPTPSSNSLFDSLVRAVNSPDFKFIFSVAGLSAEDIKLIENHPSFIDPYGGVKRRAMRERAEQDRSKQEVEANSLLQSASAEEENRESGSLQLGGEPDDVHPSRGAGGRGRETHGAIQPPSQQGTATNSAVGSPVSLNHQFQNLSFNDRNFASLQQQQLVLLKSTNGQHGAAIDPLQTAIGNSAFDHASPARQGLVQGQIPQLSGMQGHARQSSRFSFANDSTSKSSSNARMLGQQASLMPSVTPNPLVAPTPQHGLANHFYASNVQGPPPGLKTAGTPPISGGGMFAQGHGFTTNTNLGLGANVGKQDSNPELMRELLRGRSGTGGAGGVQGHEAAKREFIFPFIQQHQTPPPLTPATGLLSSFYGSQAGAYSEPGPQKQKKKGKKHRHANTSSGGGGVVDLADPSILPRVHQVGANAAGQALYGSQGQGLPEAGKPTESAEDSAADKVDQKLDPAKRNKLKDFADKDVRFVSVDETICHRKTATSEPWKSNNTLEQLIKDSQASGISIKELFLERTSPLQLLLAQLHSVGALDLNSHPLFNPPNLNQRSDMKCSPDDYSHLRHPIELSEEHRKKLLRGEPVHIHDNSNLHKNKCMITPRGCVLRHLSTEEEDRYIMLEKSISASSVLQEYPALSVTDPDLTNREGGLDALFATPEKFNIRWVDERPQTGLTSESIAAVESSIQPDLSSSVEIKTKQGHDWTSANTAELINATAASVRNFAAATAKHVLGTTVAALGGDLPDTEDVYGMSDSELRTFIDKSQRELETARKEFDAIDKRLAALVKRNKKLVHHALATTLE
ncbi:hypothetical protein V8E54_005894 [Elaphomyces granulatus]